MKWLSRMGYLWPHPRWVALLLLGMAATTAAVTLGWDPSPGASGYKLYYGTQPSNYTSVIDCGRATSNRVINLQQGTKYYFAVTAYNPVGESAFSPEISYTVPSPPLPPPRLFILPDSVTMTLEGSQSVTGQWNVIGSTQGFFRGFVR